MRLFRIFSLALLVALAAGAADVRAQAAGVFARMGFGARGLALGNALVADGFGDASPYYNPALAPFATRQNLEASAAFLTLDRELQFLQFAAPLKPVAGIAAGLVHAGTSRIDGRDNSGYHTDDYSTDEFAFFLAFGTRLSDRVSAGVGIQLFRTDLFEDLKPATSIGLDFGLNVRATDALRIGLALDDLLARYSWDTSDLYAESGKTTSDRFPARLRLGAAYALMDGRARLMAEYESRITSAELRTRNVVLVGDAPREITETERLRLHDGRFRLGAEYRVVEMLALRAGLDRIGDGEAGAMTPTAGFMLEQPVGTLVLRAEYAFLLEPYAVGTMHLLTLRVYL